MPRGLPSVRPRLFRNMNIPAIFVWTDCICYVPCTASNVTVLSTRS